MIDLDLDDKTLEWAAQFIEQHDFIDIAGIAARKKRDREDAELRMKTRHAIKAEMANHMRAFKSRRDLDAREVLRRVVEWSDESHCGISLTEAWPLAWKGWLDIHAHIKCNSNQVPPQTHYTVTLTERGRKILE